MEDRGCNTGREVRGAGPASPIRVADESSRPRHLLLLAALTIALLAGALLPSLASAATIVVDDTGSPSGAPPPTGTCEAPNYGTIQAAVDAATAGDTIQVCAGTYVESVNVNKQLTLSGPNAGISAGWDAGTRELEATIRGEMNVSAAGTVIDGLEFVRPDVPTNTVPKLIEAVGVSEQITVRNSSFDLRVFGSDPASVGCGSAVWGKAAWAVEDNGFANQFYTGGSSACGSSGNLYNSRVVWLDGAQPSVVRGNAFEKTGQGAYITGSQPAGTVVESNTFNGGLGVLVGSTTGVEIRGNSFLAGNGPYLDSSTDTVIENNLLCGGAGGGPEDPSFPECVSRTGAMIWSTGPQSGAVASENALLGGYASSVVAPFGGRGIFNYGPNDLDLSDNWWGDLNRAEIAAKRYENPGGLPFAPWIASYTPDPAKAGQPGFWPTEIVTGPCTTTCYVNDATGNDSNGGTSPDDAFKTIQEGIDTASAGGTVIVAAGIYSDEQTGDFADIYIPPGKDGLTVRGTDPASKPVVQLNEFQPGTAIRQVAGVDIRSDDVTIESMKFEEGAEGGDYGPQSNFRIAANAENPDGVQGLTLKNVDSFKSYGQNIQIQKGDTAQAIVTHSDLVFDDVWVRDSGGRGIFVAGNAQTVDGLTVKDSNFENLGLLESDPGSKHGIQTQAPVDDLTITDSTFTGVPSGGISLLAAVGGEDNLIEDVTVSGTTAANDTQSGISVFNLFQRPDGTKSIAENITINRATVTGFAGRGILVAAGSYGGCAAGCEVDDVVVQNSTVTNAGNNGVMVLAASAGTAVSDVAVTDNEIGFTGSTAGRNGIYVEGFFGPVTGFEISGNEFSGGAKAVEVIGPGQPTTGLVTRNSLRAGDSGDPAVGVDAWLDAPLDATCNWWGQAAGPATGQAFGNVNTGAGTLRFLQSAGLDSPCIGNPQPIIDPASFKTVGSLVSLQGADNWDIPDGTGPLTLGYQWETCGFFICEPGDWSPISGATASTYRLTESDLGKSLRAVITATNPGPDGGSATYPALDIFRNPFGPVIAPSSSADELTPAGENVQVNFPAIDNGQQISLDFGCEITQAGTTTVQSRDESQVPAVQGFRFGDPPTASTIETTAIFDCEGEEVVSVCTTFDTDSLPGGEQPRLFHFVGGAWQDVTLSWDPDTGILCGDVTSFSPFAVGVQVDPPPPPPTYLLSVNKAIGDTGTGTVTSTPAGIDCGNTCQRSYDPGTQVVLTATPSPGSRFTGWTGACTNEQGPCSLTMNGNRVVTARFTAVDNFQLSVSKQGNGGGTVDSSPAGINCGTTCQADFSSGTQVTLTASADLGSVFTGWSGACSGTGPCQVTMDQAREVTATFQREVPRTLTLSVTKQGTGTGTVTSTPSGINCGAVCSSAFESGTEVTLTAMAGPDSTFEGWSGACTGTGSCQVTMDEAKEVTATFDDPPPPPPPEPVSDVRIELNTTRPAKVPPNRVVKAVRVRCEGDAPCRIDRASAQAKARKGKSRKAQVSFQAGTFQPGTSRIIQVTIPQAVYNSLRRGVKSGLLTVDVRAQGTEGPRDAEIRVGLQR